MTFPLSEAVGRKERVAISREGIPWREYRWSHLVLSFLPAIAIYILIRIWARTVREVPYDWTGKFPPNALMVVYHGENYTSGLCDKFWGDFDFTHGRWFWIGYHGFLSYIGSLWPYTVGMEAFRYKWDSKQRPMDQLREFLKDRPQQGFGVRTDAGGPYGKVRPSVVKLALETHRPVVGVRQKPNWKLTIRSHDLPLPFSKITSNVTRVFTPEELRAVPFAEAVAKIQTAMDELF